MSGDVVESTSYILKKGYNEYRSKAGGVHESVVEREGMVVKQLWEWWFLTFDLRLMHYNTPDTAACTAVSILSTTPDHPPPKRPLRASFITLCPCMDAAELRKPMEDSHNRKWRVQRA